FSSRRRHTRFSRDWSSDVCSSDLVMCAWQSMKPGTVRRPARSIVSTSSSAGRRGSVAPTHAMVPPHTSRLDGPRGAGAYRSAVGSEERRGGEGGGAEGAAEEVEWN